MSVQGITMQNGPQFHLMFTRCTDVKASFLRVVAPESSPNTDGIHLNDTTHAQIMDNLISTGQCAVHANAMTKFGMYLLASLD